MNFPIMPQTASNYAVSIDDIYFTLVALTVIFTGIVTLMLLVFAVRYRRGTKVSRKNPSTGNLYMELTWSIIPMLLGLWIYGWSAIPYSRIYGDPPANASEIFLIGKRWMWHFQHVNSGIRENNELHIPVGKAVKVTMISQDVIHGFYVPAFRLKRDCLPGRYNTVWFRPNKIGKYYLFCSEYCGTNHSEMGGYVYVMSPQDYAQWKSNGGSQTLKETETTTEIGHDLFEKYGCAQCHGAQDNVHGPSMNGLFGTTVTLANGQSATVDDNFLRTAIINPQAQRIAGWPAIMSGFPVGSGDGQISEENLLDLISYIKSLGNSQHAAPVVGNNSTSTVALKPLASKPAVNHSSSLATKGQSR